MLKDNFYMLKVLKEFSSACRQETILNIVTNSYKEKTKTYQPWIVKQPFSSKHKIKIPHPQVKDLNAQKYENSVAQSMTNELGTKS